MDLLQATTTAGNRTVLDGDIVQDFAERLRGQLITPGDAGYDDARQVWNSMINKRPAIALNVCWTGPIEEGKRTLQPLREHGAPLVDLVGPKPYMTHQSSIDLTVLYGWHYYWKSTGLPELSDDLIDVLVEHAFSAMSSRSYSVIFQLGGAVRRIPSEATAYAGWNACHNINVNGVWLPEENLAASETAWARKFFDALEPFRKQGSLRKLPRCRRRRSTCP